MLKCSAEALVTVDVSNQTYCYETERLVTLEQYINYVYLADETSGSVSLSLQCNLHVFINSLVQPSELGEFSSKSPCRHGDVNLESRKRVRRKAVWCYILVENAFDALFFAHIWIDREYLCFGVKLDHFAIDSLRDKDQIPEQGRLFNFRL